MNETGYTASDILLDKIKEFEGCRLTAYKCPGGVWTIGYGHTRGVTQGDTCTVAEAEAMLGTDLVTYESYVNSLSVCKTQGQFDALVDFAFNCGCDALGSSTLLKRIQAQADDDEIEAQFMRWVYSGGKKLSGLVRRREWEAQRWVE